MPPPGTIRNMYKRPEVNTVPQPSSVTGKFVTSKNGNCGTHPTVFNTPYNISINHKNKMGDSSHQHTNIYTYI